MKKSTFKRMFSLFLVICMLSSLGLTAVSAAEVADATVHMDEECSLTIYKYDFTNAAKDGIWSQDSYVSTGQYDTRVNTILGDATREGADSNSSKLGNESTSNGYAIKGVEFTYLKVADLYQFTESAKDNQELSHIEVLYKFDKVLAADLLKAIGLTDGAKSYANANALDETSWYYQSDVLNKALADSLTTNATTVKNALEAYVKAKNGTAMVLTNEDGRTSATKLPVGLYLLVETKVPEQVTTTTDPFFISLPMTSVNGGMKNPGSTRAGVDPNGFNDGGHYWIYDVTIYPKNQTGIVTLEKTVREAKKDTGNNTGSLTDITDGFAHTATASAGDTVEFQILSTLPTITSAATSIAEYTFQDVLSRGMSYDSKTPVVIEFFKNDTCKTDELVATWKAADDKFKASQTKNSDGTTTMEIKLTEKGLAEINAANTSADNANGSLYAGYSNYTMRITYAATLNSDESLVYGDAGNDNQVVLTWRRTSSSYYDTLIDDCHVFTYGINLVKTFSDGKNDQSLFDHVLFKVQNKNDGYFVVASLNEEEGIWYVTGHTDKESAATALHPVDWNNKKGQLVIKGLEDDEYIMTEIETANSYTLLKEDISVAISVADDKDRPCNIYAKDKLGVVQNDPRYSFDGGLDLELANIPQAKLAHNFLTASATVDGNAVTMINDEMDTTSTNALAPLNVVNTHGFDLPQTGETSASWMPIVGGTIIGICMICLLFVLMPQRKKDEQ